MNVEQIFEGRVVKQETVPGRGPLDDVYSVYDTTMILTTDTVEEFTVTLPVVMWSIPEGSKVKIILEIEEKE